MGGVVRRVSGRQRLGRTGRTLRQRWRWVPLPVRLRFAQLRSRWAHRRALLRLLGAAIVVPVVAVTALAGPEPAPSIAEAASVEVVVPEDHRVLSLPIDDRVPLLNPGDRIDLYVSVDGFAGTEGVVELLDDAGLVVSVDDASFSVAVSAGQVGSVAEAIRGGGVLVVRR